MVRTSIPALEPDLVNFILDKSWIWLCTNRPSVSVALDKVEPQYDLNQQFAIFTLDKNKPFCTSIVQPCSGFTLEKAVLLVLLGAFSPVWYEMRTSLSALVKCSLLPVTHWTRTRLLVRYRALFAHTFTLYKDKPFCTSSTMQPSPSPRVSHWTWTGLLVRYEPFLPVSH